MHVFGSKDHILEWRFRIYLLWAIGREKRFAAMRRFAPVVTTTSDRVFFQDRFNINYDNSAANR